MDPNLPRELQYLISAYNCEAILSLPLEHTLVIELGIVVKRKLWL